MRSKACPAEVIGADQGSGGCTEVSRIREPLAELRHCVGRGFVPEHSTEQPADPLGRDGGELRFAKLLRADELGYEVGQRPCQLQLRAARGKLSRLGGPCK